MDLIIGTCVRKLNLIDLIFYFGQSEIKSEDFLQHQYLIAVNHFIQGEMHTKLVFVAKIKGTLESRLFDIINAVQQLNTNTLLYKQTFSYGFIQKSYFSIRFYYIHGFDTVSFFPFSTKIDGNNNRRSISKHTQYVPTHTANAAVEHVIRWATTHIQNKHTRIKWVFIFSYWECNSNMESRNRSSGEYTEKKLSHQALTSLLFEMKRNGKAKTGGIKSITKTHANTKLSVILRYERD